MPASESPEYRRLASELGQAQAEASSQLEQADTLAALDTGEPGAVFARHGSRDWIGDLALMIAGALILRLRTWRVPYRIARRRARRDAFLIPER